MASTKDVLNHHLKAFEQGDLNGVLSDYGPGVVFFTREGPLKGVDAIRPLFEALIADDYAYILWTAKTADNVYELATDTFVVREGKIVAQSFTAKITPRN